jgi:transcriptional regulator with XRE-family HTH domain
VHDEPDLALAAHLKRLREAREITQEELAFDAGLTASALSRIERGLNSPGWMTVRRIADALEVSVADVAAEVEAAEAEAAEAE